MDAIRVAKVRSPIFDVIRDRLICKCQVEGVLCSKAGLTQPGTLHLTAHHLIFAYDETGKEEMWVSVTVLQIVSCVTIV